jgi:hypothetical protein
VKFNVGCARTWLRREPGTFYANRFCAKKIATFALPIQI